MEEKVLTREQYLNGECSHDQYYSQFVTEKIKQIVANSIGIPVILACKDPHFNTIPLKRWDSLEPIIKIFVNTDKIRKAENWSDPTTYPWSLATSVCIAKQAAKHIKKNKGA